MLAGVASQVAGSTGVGETVSSQTSPELRQKQRLAQPNLILFMPDELRADALACYGNPLTHTPNFDKLAQQGTRFANCHVQFPVCGASRCSLLTGWPTSVRGHRSLFYFLRPNEPNLFRSLRQAGYDVFWYGKNDALAAESFSESGSLAAPKETAGKRRNMAISGPRFAFWNGRKRTALFASFCRCPHRILRMPHLRGSMTCITPRTSMDCGREICRASQTILRRFVRRMDWRACLKIHFARCGRSITERSAIATGSWAN